MASTQDAQEVSQNEPQEEAEVFAASAAENALSDSKSPQDEPSDLSALTTTVDTDKENLGKVSNEEDKKEVAEKDDSEAPERVLTKEEMVEEALNCPCIAAMKEGPCGDSFLSAYRCFLESETEPKGMDCMEQFSGMQSCMAEHPDEYNMDDDDDPFAVDSSNDHKEGKKETTTAGDSNK